MSNDKNDELLMELRKLTRYTQFSMWLGIAVLVAAVAFMLFLRHERQRYNQARPVAQQAELPAWKEVDAAMDRLDYRRGLTLAQAVVARDTNYYYGHTYLGNIYVALGDTTNAEAHYLRAYELWPDESNEKNLAAIRRRLAMDRGKPPSK
jgi:cytochrome c-type biogenesis protein CcmH/NrfG